MHLSQLIYASRSTDTERLTIGKILSAARRFNGPNDITGLLLFDGTFYLQCLEGDRAVVGQLYQRIAEDSRHKDLVVLAAATRDERDCPYWSMGYIDNRDVVRAAIQRFSTTSVFDPYSMSSESVLGLVRHITHSKAVRKTMPRQREG